MKTAFALAALTVAAVAWLEVAAAEGPAAARSGDAAAGQDLFLDRCVTCHIPEGGGQGPSLKGVYGRPAASVEGFAYSAALKASGLTWTGPALDRFLTDPGAAVPGTAMPIRITDAGQRADLISYFKSKQQEHR